ncbi:tol-pal system protein YbgF [Rickettsia prowazekii]|uniref:tol-pal system protein YbgF n=1 Tax=Rickettsia prowazekii TaxID=782 RepID=UPI001F44C1AE|nr:tol-pal system protein YbgF [Rickettsia prowazekii]
MFSLGKSEMPQGKPLKYAVNNDFENRLDEQEQEIRKLIGKVEILQHKIDLLKQNLNMLNQEENIEVLETDDFKKQDIFDIALLEGMHDNVSKKTFEVNKDIAPYKQAYDLALAAYKDNKLTEAKDKFKNFIQKYPNNSLISNAYFWYAECFFKQKDYNGAAINYLKCYKESPKGAKSSDGLLKLALSLGELKKMQEACNILAKLDKEFPINRTSVSKKMTEDAKIKFGCKINKNNKI